MGHRPRKRNTPGNKREILYGFHPVMEALAAGRRTIHALMVDRTIPTDRQRQLVDMAKQRHIVWHAHTAEQIRALCGSDQHQGIAASVSTLPLDSLEAIFRSALPAEGGPLLVLLDGIVDPHNLGAIVRTAHCVGADAMVVPKDRAVGATPTVSKISAGALEHMRLCQVTNLAGSMQWLKKQGVWVAGLTMQADQTIFQADFKGPLALVIGGEEKGLRRLVRQYCDYLVSIPQQGRVDSLNASAAAAVVLYEAFRQRRFALAQVNAG
jgi:23S rRNA (guanosine2251-2'-O)-methyltransferase